MPTYEYVCENCKHELEIVQSFSEDALVRCPQCDDDGLRRRIFPAGIIFKGDGWYVTDNRSKQEKNSAKKDSEEGEKKQKSDTKATDGTSDNGESPKETKPAGTDGPTK